MSNDRIKDFIDKQLKDLDNFTFEIQSDCSHTYAIFSLILDKVSNKELTFKLLDDVLYLHSTTYGWKAVEKGAGNKYFWLELLALD